MRRLVDHHDQRQHVPDEAQLAIRVQREEGLPPAHRAAEVQVPGPGAVAGEVRGPDGAGATAGGARQCALGHGEGVVGAPAGGFLDGLYHLGL